MSLLGAGDQTIVTVAGFRLSRPADRPVFFLPFDITNARVAQRDRNFNCCASQGNQQGLKAGGVIYPPALEARGAANGSRGSPSRSGHLIMTPKEREAIQQALASTIELL